MVKRKTLELDWAGHLSSLCLSYPICKMELILAPKSWCRYEDLQDAPAPHAEPVLDQAAVGC